MFKKISNKLNGNSVFLQELRRNAEVILSKLGASTRKTVAVSISQNRGIEMLEIDNLAGVITKYATRELPYDVVNRKIENYKQFAECIKDLFEEFDISSNSNVVLSLPNIYFGLIEIPKILHGDAVRNVILSEVEQSYVFKSNEPLISWHNLTKNKKDKNTPNFMVFSAIQKDVIDSILEACEDIGCRFLTIENSNLSILRGLSLLGYTKDYVKDNSIWQLMLVDASSFSIFTMSGSMPIDYVEEPLAMKSYEEGEIYNAIASTANEFINNKKLKSKGLTIISQTDFVSAEILKNELETTQHIDFFECNKYSSLVLYPTSFDIATEEAEQISLSAIGTAAYIFYSYNISLNFIQENVEELEHIDDQIGNIKVNIGNIELSITRETIRRLSFILAGVILLPLLVIYLSLGQWFLPKEKAKAEDLSFKINSINKQIEDLTKSDKTSEFDINKAILTNVGKNKKLLINYSGLGEVKPKNLWITYSQENESELLIEGVSSSTQIIYDFYKNLKIVTNNSDLIINKLKLSTENLDRYISIANKLPKNLFYFEITNKKEAKKTNNVGLSFNLSEKEIDEQEDTGRITVSAPPPISNKNEEVTAEGNENNTSKDKKVNKKSSKSEDLPANLKKIENIGN